MVTTAHFLEPFKPSPHPHTILLIHFNFILHLRLGFPSSLFLSFLLCLICAKQSVQIRGPGSNILDLNNLVISLRYCEHIPFNEWCFLHIKHCTFRTNCSLFVCRTKLQPSDEENYLLCAVDMFHGGCLGAILSYVQNFVAHWFTCYLRPRSTTTQEFHHPKYTPIENRVSVATRLISQARIHISASH